MYKRADNSMNSKRIWIRLAYMPHVPTNTGRTEKTLEKFMTSEDVTLLHFCMDTFYSTW